MNIAYSLNEQLEQLEQLLKPSHTHYNNALFHRLFLYPRLSCGLC